MESLGQKDIGGGLRFEICCVGVSDCTTIPQNPLTPVTQASSLSDDNICSTGQWKVPNSHYELVSFRVAFLRNKGHQCQKQLKVTQ